MPFSLPGSTATPSSSRTPSASTKRTTASPGSTPTSASTAPTTSTSSTYGWTWRSTGRPTPSTRSTQSSKTTSATRYRNAWYTRATLVKSEKDGARAWNWDTNRYWTITSGKTNELGQKTAYKLEPRGVVKPFVQHGSYIYDRTRFVQKPLWVTRYDPKEKYAAGDYMAQSPDIQGLPAYLEDHCGHHEH